MSVPNEESHISFIFSLSTKRYLNIYQILGAYLDERESNISITKQNVMGKAYISEHIILYCDRVV